MRDWTKSILDEGPVEEGTTRAGEDMKLLRKALDGDVPNETREAFKEMLDDLVMERRQSLSGKQRDWVRKEIDAHTPQYENLVSSGKVPRGREVPTPPALQNLPKRPPSRPKLED